MKCTCGKEMRLLHRPPQTTDPDDDGDDHYQCWECGETKELDE